MKIIPSDVEDWWTIDEPGFERSHYPTQERACGDLARLRMVKMIKEVGGDIGVK